jgi:hypothetical protein
MTALALFKMISTTLAAHITHKRVWRLLVRSVSRHPELRKAQGSPNRPSSDNIIADKQSRDDPDDNASWSDLEGMVVSLRVVLKRCAPASIRGSLSIYIYTYISGSRFHHHSRKYGTDTVEDRLTVQVDTRVSALIFGSLEAALLGEV